MNKFIFGLSILSAFYAGFSAKDLYSYLNRAAIADDVCKLDGRYISPRELQGCEVTATNMMYASRNCERSLEREEEQHKECKRKLNILQNGIRSIPPMYK